ncbi:piggyBac transposable element-derived protein 2-like [Pseudophryne corroboree]|uniref:piggyBac transposable element-derived protein 2-like n=1 Tax=Pseudophryne corroboree TaxID=495146 RepID=UPI003081F863
MMENHRPLTSLDGPSNRDTPERCPRPLYSQDCTEENHRIPQEDQDQNLTDIKVVAIKGEEETYVTVIKAEDTEGEEETYVRGDQQCKEEEIPTDISTGTHATKGRGLAPPILRLGNWNSTHALEKISSKANGILTVFADGPSNRDTPERCPRPLYSQDCAEENHRIPQEDQDEYQSDIKVEDIGEEEMYVTNMKAEDIEGEEETYVTDVKAEDTEGEVETYVTDVKAEDIEGEEETYVRGDQQCKEEEIPTDISTDGPSNRDTPERCPRPLYSQDCTEENHRIPQVLQTSRASSKRVRYRVVEEIPSCSSDTDTSSDHGEWEPDPKEEEGSFSSCSETDDDDDDEVVAVAKGNTKLSTLWKAKDNDFEGVLPTFVGQHKVKVEGTEPIHFFMHLFSDTMVDEIVHNTNLYTLQKRKGYLSLTSHELKCFLGINLVMSYLRYPRSRMYWSSNEGLRFDLIANAMPVYRFEEILRYLHFVDNFAQQPGNKDKLCKIRPVLDKLEASFSGAVDPEEFQSVDEQIIPFKVHQSIGQSIGQSIPKRSKPLGLKMWVRAGTSGYTYRFELYQGTSGDRDEVSALGKSAAVVLRLCDDIQNKNHKVFFGIPFCTIPLLQKLRNQGIYATSTCSANSIIGAQSKLKTEKQLKEEGRGASSVVTNGENISITRWLDGSVVHVASSCAGIQPQDSAQRWSKKEKELIHIPRPFAVKLYNTHIRGVNLMDQCVAMYPHRRKNRRWYIRVFFHFLDVTCVNAWLLYRMSGFNDMNLLDFKASIARALINAGCMEQRRRERSSETPPPLKRRAVSKAPPEIRFSVGHHWPKLTDAKHANRCHDVACTRKTKYICMQCLEPLCPGCFSNFHTKR